MVVEKQIDLDLDLSPIQPTLRPTDLSIDDAFQAFHEANPHVLRNIRSLALLARQAGRKRIGMKFLFERLRWEYTIRTNHGDDEFRLNNNYTSRYARMLMEQEPQLEGFFETREIRS